MSQKVRKENFNIISISSNLPWSNMWKRNQMMLHQLSRQESVNRIVFVNPDLWLMDLVDGFRKKISQDNHKLYRFSLKAILPKRVGRKIYAITPFYCIPFLGKSRLLSVLQTKLHCLIINRLFTGRNIILILNDFSSEKNHRRLVKQFMKKAKLVVYDWSDDFVEFFKDRKGRDQVRHTCEEYIKGADLVFAVNNDLYERAGRINTNTYQLANATDYEGISRAVGCNCEAPQSLAGFSKPLLGYIGWITAMRMDTEILKEIAVRHPEWTLVLIGPSGETFRILFQKNKNVVFLPPVDYREMPYYLKVFDVCLIPHKVNEHTRGNNPIKIYDYLAAGKPIVSTPVAGVEALQELIYLAKSPPEFTAMIERALAENTPELQAARMRTAKGNSWTSRIDEAWRLITQHIEAKHPDLKRPANEGETSTKKLKKTAGCHVMR